MDKKDEKISLSAQIQNKLIEDLHTVNAELNEEVKIRVAAEEELLKANKSLQESLKVKQSLIEEVHHRVKNNLQLMSSLLYLQAEEEGEEWTIKEFISSVQGRIIAIRNVHEMFLGNVQNDSVNIVEYLQNTIPLISKSLDFKGSISILGEENVQMRIDRCSYLGLVLNELISNSVKHAWKNHEDNRVIKIIVKVDKKNVLKIQYLDNGSNIKSSSSKMGKGSFIVETLCTSHLQGTINNCVQDCIEDLKCILIAIPID
jgi:two-component sensor histidine kinase